MATEKQIKANRENAKLAGVKTAEGKAIARHNSFKHGLRAKDLLAAFADIPDAEVALDKILKSLQESFSPQNGFEEVLVGRMALAQFKQSLGDQLELQSFEHRETWKLGLAIKYRNALDAQFYRAYAILMQSRQQQQSLDSFVPTGGNND